MNVRFTALVGLIFMSGLVLPFPACSQSGIDFGRLTVEMERHLDDEILSLWYPRSVDVQRGGFHETFDETWKPLEPNAQRSIVYQSRLTWVAAEVSRRYPHRAIEYRAYAKQGAAALSEQLWDHDAGGFYWQVDAKTKRPMADRGDEKHAYGIAFGIYALANVYLATKDADALSLAKKAFAWLDQHAHDAANGGYFEALDRRGKPILEEPMVGKRDAIGTQYGMKSMNSHIHILEAFTELHKAWPDRRVRVRLAEVFKIVSDRVFSEPGFLHLYFQPNWKAVPNHDSFGHDIETAYLLLEAADELGLHRDPRARAIAVKLVDHAMLKGWDEVNGGFYDHGAAEGQSAGTDKVWWTQAEGLNALLLRATLAANPSRNAATSRERYLTAFGKQWEFIVKHQIDRKYGGWHTSISAEGKSKSGQNKSDMWKDPYHQGRAVMNVIAGLRLIGRDKQ